ncbi:MFS transporter [Nonomuraea jabiensis]|uniref:MHS family proline/betaine transporter-like MFS transporter n=1 Tax=Nonomuraea jabiensis TaxID=882448 RepID=A0A7W9GFL5_9ACTN|nr:MFS transporter [Nonomuraea jabiensis]MBB5782806.1 MHS family proline/betaine transporter-like MFS transporter [Nonomuraea jabiensis]
MSTPVANDPDVVHTPRARRRLFASTMIGNAVEYYDFTLYGTLAAVIASHFFPEGETTAALLAAYVGVALSYFIRPLGAMILGPLADLKGRRPVLVLTIMLMTVGTAGIGVLPTYAAAGVVAPVLLLTARVVQGLGASVEFTTAANFLLEHEDRRRRNYVLGSLNSTASIGSFLAAGVAFLLTQTMSAEAFASWGWRIPFLLAIPLSAVAVYIRRRLSESPEFEAVQRLTEQQKVPQTPLRTAVRYYWPDMLRSIGLSAGQRIGSFVIQAYFVTALISAGFPTSLALLASMITYVVGPVPSIYGGYLADKYGARVPLLIGYGLFIVLTVPTFIGIGSGSILIAVLAVVGFTIINNLISAPMMAAAVLSFPPEVRSSAAALNFNIATSLIGSTAGLVAVWLHDITQSDVTFGWYMTGFCLLSFLTAIFALPTGARRELPTNLLAERK